MKIYDKNSLIAAITEIKNMGWVRNARRGNDGGVGNTLEDLLGIEENNLPLPNAAEWELKCQRSNTSSLTTLFHMEPSPTALRFVPNILLPNYGWPHQKAGVKYPVTEKSFRQTINGLARTNRGFGISVDHVEKRVSVSFDAASVDRSHADWLVDVEHRTGLGELNPQPYWGFNDLFHKLGSKLTNCFYVQADVKKEGGHEFYYYNRLLMLQDLDIDKVVHAIEQGDLLIDFDARTGHNHGTKFRLKQNKLPALYRVARQIF